MFCIAFIVLFTDLLYIHIHNYVLYTMYHLFAVCQTINKILLHCVSKNDTALACYNFDMHQPILIIFGRNVAKKVRSQMVLYFSTSPN